MECNCANLPEVFYLDDGPTGFEKRLNQLDTQEWMGLYECPECKTVWIIDAWDKYSVRVVSRKNSRDEWPTTISEEKRKQLLLASRGGTTDEKCDCNDCTNYKVKGVALCLDHLYDAGVRK